MINTMLQNILKFFIYFKKDKLHKAAQMGDVPRMRSFIAKGADVNAVDKGALDCTVRARITAAIYRGAERDDYQF